MRRFMITEWEYNLTTLTYEEISNTIVYSFEGLIDYISKTPHKFNVQELYTAPVVMSKAL